MDWTLTPALLSQDATPTLHGEALLRTARMLRDMASGGGRLPPLLRSRHLALLSRRPHARSQAVVEAAARCLGAHVARLPAASVQGEEAQACETARMLGRLYDAMDCEDLPLQAVLQLRQYSGVPVYDGLGRRDHPIMGLLPCLEAAPAGKQERLRIEESRQYLLQALLLQTLR
ncbi:hypothetical protein [Azohydromonas aeria]|uniref:hypothetical protein n=1 Tax=Azohydromonas aeria TaxID=2590212 RepID=UPI0012FA5861|nr:hypothetical protein [Azohydromonas aeria]